MIISSITIQNIRHFELFASKIPSVALITGNHGVGKTSLMECVKYALGERGLDHDPTMLRIAAGVDEGSILLNLSDGTQIRCDVTSTSTKRLIKTPGATRWSTSRAEIDSLVNALSYDPLRFGDLTPRQQIDTLLKITPIPVTPEELKEAAGSVFTVPDIPEGSNGLEIISSAYDQIYKTRATVNSQSDTLKKHAAQLETGLPPASATGDWSAIATQLTAEIAALKKSESDTIARLQREVNSAKENEAETRRVTDDEINRDINAKIAALESERSQRKMASAKHEGDAVDAAKAKALKELEGIRAELNPQITRLTEESATARERADAQKRTQGTMDAIIDAREKSAAFDSDSKAMTMALENLTRLKGTVAGRMSIRGVTIGSPKPGMEVSICRQEGDALVPFSVWNDEGKLMFMLRLATMSHGKCGLICIDSLGDLNKAKQEMLIKTARKYSRESGLQFLLGRADEPGVPLTVVDAGEEK